VKQGQVLGMLQNQDQRAAVEARRQRLRPPRRAVKPRRAPTKRS
jgi:hypothetical protein